MGTLLQRLVELNGQRTQGEWRTYPIFGEGYAELFGPACSGGKVVLGSQADAAFLALAANLMGDLLAVVEAAKRECFVDGTGYYRTHVSDELHRAIKRLEGGG